MIVRELVISGKTVGDHISAIFAKLQVADRAEAIARAREAGLGSAGVSDVDVKLSGREPRS